MGNKLERQNQHQRKLKSKIKRFEKKGWSTEGLKKELAYCTGETARPEFATGHAEVMSKHKRNLLQFAGKRSTALKNNFYCPLAQLVEQVTVNHWVRGSSPRGAAILREINVQNCSHRPTMEKIDRRGWARNIASFNTLSGSNQRRNNRNNSELVFTTPSST